MQNITLETIKKTLCPNKTNKDFVNLVFHPLKDAHQFTFTDSFGEKHLSVFMKGNHDGQRRLNARRLKLWSEVISEESVFQEMCSSLVSLTDVCGVDAQHEVYSLLQLDKHEMPASLVHTIESLISGNDHAAAVLLLILWSVYGQEQIDLLHKLYQDVPQTKTGKGICLLSHTKPCRPVFKGRDGIIEQINSHFASGRGFLFLQGMGGIGKSECAKQYAERYRGNYDTVVFAEYSDSIVNLINDNLTFTLTEPFVSERIIYSNGTAESDYEFYQRKLTSIRLSSDSRVLIILDNLDQYDPKLEDLLAGPFRLLVTTRWRSQNVYPQDTLQVGEIQNMKMLKEIFSAYYGEDISYDADAEQLIEMFHGHTMAMELIAKQMKASCLVPEEMLEIMKDHNGQKLREGILIMNYGNTKMSMSNYMYKLFNVTTLTDAEKYILMCMSLMPPSGVDKSSFRKWCGLRDYENINILAERSWLSDSENILSIHSLIKEMVIFCYKPDLMKCSAFIEAMMNDVTTMRYNAMKLSQKRIFETVILNIYRVFPEPAEEMYSFYEWLELKFTQCGQYDTAAQLSARLWSIYHSKWGDDNFRTARMLCRKACGLTNAFDSEKSIFMLEQSRAVIKTLESDTAADKLYVSGIDIVLISLYSRQYSEPPSESELCQTEKLCLEIIADKERYQSSANAYTYVSCAVAWNHLLKLELIREDPEKASVYCQKFLDEYEAACKIIADSSYFQVLLKNKTEKNAIEKTFDSIVHDINLDAHNVTGFHRDFINNGIELCRLYEKHGKYDAAHGEYEKLYWFVRNVEQKDEDLLSSLIDKMNP